MSFSRNRYIVSGNVQGVRYRDYIAEVARKFSLTGHVENMPDGSVEIIVEGNPDDLKNFEALMKEDKKNKATSSPTCLASGIDFTFYGEEATDKFHNFRILYSSSLQEELNENFKAAMLIQVKTNDALNNLIEQTRSFSEQTNNNFQHLDTKYHKNL